MRSIITPVVALVWTALAATPAMAQIPWNNDLQAAHAQAKQEGKALLMHFYTDNCVFCDRLESGAFQSPALAAAIAKDFVPVKIHAAMNPKIAKTFRVTRFPTDVIVTTDGTVLSHGVSPQDPQRYVNLLAQHTPSTPPQSAVVQTQTPPSAPATLTQASSAQPPTNPSAVAAIPGPSGYAGYAGALPGGSLAGAPSPGATLSGGSAPIDSQANASWSADAMSGLSMPKPNPYGPSGVADQPDTQVASGEGFGLPMNVGHSADVAAYRPKNNPTPAEPFDGGSADAPSRDTAVRATSAPAADRGSVAIAPELEADLKSEFAPSASDTSGRSSAETIAAGDKAQSKTPPIALQGFCPVALVESEQWVAGDPAYGSIHLGQLYLFVDQASLEKFRANPDPYTPVMNGNDVVLFFEERRVVEGRRDWGLWDPEFNRIFLFATEETMNHFYDHHQDYVRSAITVTRQAAMEANSKLR